MTDKPSEMVERVAEALAVQHEAAIDLSQTLFWEALARAAIEAIEGMGYVIVPREPTEAMVRCATLGDDGDRSQFHEMWRWAIDAVLAEGKHAAPPS